MKICFATHNENKLREINQILPDFEIVGLTEIGCTEEIPETGKTLEENSKIKATHVAEHYGVGCFADDTGLEVEALNGDPGVYSARYAGDNRDNKANIDLLIKNLLSFENKAARFRTVITLILDGEMHQFDGVVNGKIIDEWRGEGGFGYDPVFVPDGYNQTFAQMTAEQKNDISHRGRAVTKLVNFLKDRE